MTAARHRIRTALCRLLAVLPVLALMPQPLAARDLPADAAPLPGWASPRVYDCQQTTLDLSAFTIGLDIPLILEAAKQGITPNLVPVAVRLLQSPDGTLWATLDFSDDNGPYLYAEGVQADGTASFAQETLLRISHDESLRLFERLFVSDDRMTLWSLRTDPMLGSDMLFACLAAPGAR